MQAKILLQDILPLDALSEEGPVILAKHPHSAVDEIVALGLMEEFHATQDKPAFRKCRYMLSFLALPKNQAKLFGVYEKIGIKEKENLPKQSDQLTELLGPLDPEKHFFMELKEVPASQKYKGRLIVDWMIPRGWYNTYGNQTISKEVIKLLPQHFVDDFPGLMNICIDAADLRTIIKHPEPHAKWYEALTRLQAVYLIMDNSTGHQYIGTTYGQNGLWQRWESYAKGDFTGGNAQLKDLKAQNPHFHHQLQFSILEVLPKNANKKECIAAENLWKEKLGTRAFGLNKN